jgi:hypothetical protein
LLSLIRLIDWKRRSKCQWYFGEVVQGFWCDPCLDGNSEVNSVRRSKRCIIVERNITVPVKLYGLAQYSKVVTREEFHRFVREVFDNDIGMMLKAT